MARIAHQGRQLEDKRGIIKPRHDNPKIIVPRARRPSTGLPTAVRARRRELELLQPCVAPEERRRDEINARACRCVSFSWRNAIGASRLLG